MGQAAPFNISNYLDGINTLNFLSSSFYTSGLNEQLKIAENEDGYSATFDISTLTDSRLFLMQNKPGTLINNTSSILKILSGPPGLASLYIGYKYYDSTQKTIVFSNGLNWYKVSATLL